MMKQTRILTAAAGATLILLGAVAYHVQSRENVIETPRVTQETSLSSKYYFPNQFDTAVAEGETFDARFPETPISGGIIPHDITHGEYIAHFFSQLRNQHPKTILLIGPNHFERGATPLITSSADWKTPVGNVTIPDAIVKGLETVNAISENNEVMMDEHSIAGIIPYIAYYLPGTEVLPLIFKAEIRLPEIEALITLVQTQLPPDTPVVAAVDFSHYLTAGRAQANDAITAEALKTFNYRWFMSLGPNFNDYVDSPPSITFLLKWLEGRGITQQTILYNTNSGLLSNNLSEPTTSYFEMVYY